MTMVNLLFCDHYYHVLAVQHGDSSCRRSAVNTAYLIQAPFLGKNVPNESLLHFLLLDQKLPKTLHWQRRMVASSENNTHHFIKSVASVH